MILRTVLIQLKNQEDKNIQCFEFSSCLSAGLFFYSYLKIYFKRLLDSGIRGGFMAEQTFWNKKVMTDVLARVS